MPLSGGFLRVGGTSVLDPLSKFKQRSLIHSKNIEGGLKFQKRWRDPYHAPLGGGVTPGVGLAVSIHLPNLKNVASSIGEILKEFKICRETNTGHRNDTVHRSPTSKH